jgi:hypothetical protein
MTVRRARIASSVFLFGLVWLAGSGSAQAQGRPLSEQDRKEIMAYQLSLPRANAIIEAMGEMTRYLMSRPDIAEVMKRSMQMTHAEQAAQMERDPKAMAIASKHGLDAHDYTYGGPTLRMALMAAEGASDVVVSPANLAFAKANLATLKPKLDAVDGVRRR